MKKQKGFTLIEWMIAMMIGLFIVAGVFSIFSMSKETASDTFEHGELQENGRTAMNMILRDLQQIGFWGDYTGSILDISNGVSISTTASAIINDCIDDRGGAAGSFPSANLPLRPVWVSHVADNGGRDGLSCISNQGLQNNTDILDIKRANGFDASNVNDLDDNRFYIAANPSVLEFFDGSESTPATSEIKDRRVWEYIRHIYYITSENNIPRLRMKYLANDMSSSYEIAQGIERIRLLLSVDTSYTADGISDEYLDPSDIEQRYWDENRVIGAQIFILVRSVNPRANYTNSNSYILGHDEAYQPNDHYRRILLQSVIQFNNHSSGQS